MSQYREGCQLRIDEIAAVLALAGKKTLVGFQTEDLRSLGSQQIWNACCRLVKDQMMTQIDGKFRLCPDLVDVMQPVCQAQRILALTPASDLLPQVIYYCTDRVVAMERTAFGRYVLTPMDPEEMIADLAERMELEFGEETGTEGAQLEIDVKPEDSRQTLLASALFVLEVLDGTSGTRRGWLRMVEQGMDRWLQWTQQNTLCCEELTEALLSNLLQALQRGDIQ